MKIVVLTFVVLNGLLAFAADGVWAGSPFVPPQDSLAIAASGVISLSTRTLKIRNERGSLVEYILPVGEQRVALYVDGRGAAADGEKSFTLTWLPTPRCPAPYLGQLAEPMSFAVRSDDGSTVKVLLDPAAVLRGEAENPGNVRVYGVCGSKAPSRRLTFVNISGSASNIHVETEPK